MAQKIKGSYSEEILRIINTRPEEVARMSAAQQKKYQNTLTWFREQERLAAEAEKAARRAKKPTSVKQTIKWLNLGRKKLAEDTAPNKAGIDANVNSANRDKATAREPLESAAARIPPTTAALTAEKSRSTWSTVARFLWMPQVNVSFRGFSYALSLLTQMLAQILVSSRLLPTDHPALTQLGAQAYKVLNLLREARRNVPPLRELLKQGTTEVARQYSIIISCYGVIVSGAFAVVATLFQLVFGIAHAYAQSAQTPTGPLSGLSIGAFNYTPAPGNDMGSAIVDFIFGTGSNATTSLVGAGLGTMLGFYSTMALTFAGIIVLWIIISAVAETARTGVPFGKQFNHIWAPIRLIIALGMLVPLQNGLNSGQYVGLYLVKWGSQQATQLWGMYADKMISVTSSGTPAQGTSAVASVQFDQNANQIMAKNLFKVLLCQQIYNQYVSSYQVPGANPVQTLSLAPLSTAPTGSNAVAGATNPVPFGSFSQLNPTQPQQVVWRSNVNQVTQNATANSVDCGALNTQTIGTAATANDPATAAVQAAILGQNQAVTNFIGSAGSLAASIASDAVTDSKNGSLGGNGLIAARNSSGQDYTNYQNLVAAMGTANSNNWSQNILPTYSQNLQNVMSAHAKDYGWLGAPIWMMTVSDQNGRLVDQSQALPTVTPPTLNAMQDGTASSIWSYASSYVDNLESGSQAAIVPDTQADAFSIQNALAQMTSSIGGNPMSKFAVAGRLMITYGFRLINPVNDLKCFENPFSDPAACSKEIQEGYAAAAASGRGATVWQGMTKTDIDNAVRTGNKGNYGSVLGLSNGATITPDPSGTVAALTKLEVIAKDPQLHTMLFPLGMIMISFGFMAILLVLIPFGRFSLGVLQWLMQIFEMVLGMPLFSLSMLQTSGEGLLPQQAQTNAWMVVGVVLRPVLMVLGIAIALVAFNSIMTIVNMIFAQTIANLDPTGSDKSYISLGIYMIFYGTLAYTLANSAFKAIDLLPNYIMSWIGARIESRVDDASVIQTQAQGYMQTMTYSARMGGMGGNAGGQTTAAGGLSAQQYSAYSQMNPAQQKQAYATMTPAQQASVTANEYNAAVAGGSSNGANNPQPSPTSTASSTASGQGSGGGGKAVD